MLERIQEKIGLYLKEVDSPQTLHMAQSLGMGKMLRSRLILAICARHPQLVDFCAIIEMIQTASLLHDDVIDNATTRRGHESLNHAFGNTNAIMLGDIFYSKAFLVLANFAKPIIEVVAQSVVALSRGEIKDTQMAEAFNPSQDFYIDMVADKSAALIAASSGGAALLAGLDFEKYTTFGRNFGIAFQIIDDLLDITQSKEVLGKPAFSDFKEGKSTLPYILLHQCLSPVEQGILKGYFKSPKEEARLWCSEKFKEHNIIQATLQEAKGYTQKALEAIRGENNQALEAMALRVLERQF
ncbi:polyprenyl synthetase family protein [Helicobacter heilmannii]|uniref:Octaprenyl-diphosphate synthase / Dimethylallyltransferase / Geranyltranstransferase (Farnesyldiphosphate synthase) / Geranylgeranyl pyrophosphate synthetase n=1 Tax=Helicobacter heilmannii TaxID=35817 RepID=A0A0K2XPP0_HELHE|nr:polyprenyl synthetase family protein [Helicobacter heilmannii]CCM11755.1 Octaprenyl-diphosphate synthase [Helicobacter heilmannii ASB1.4]CRF45323.1 All-trans-hexaprenyl-diphosphate synthase [Helicobacter heilmannii]CRF46770.1 All-trans-hexaprenyl-diphosphate synthase [Helicobacter heilmannii]CRF49365.1 All-trans-hexaprenyl-diphosphate synthase [Helicobacter heilmannii]CRI33894.1 Octaprenyl-diphosphate synthase / Dimethylallyltransferase / Geranyltranstransferase (farnesyldiphosphate synthas